MACTTCGRPTFTCGQQLSITPLRDATGDTGGRLIMLRDISALKHAERDLQTANTQLRAQVACIESLQLELKEQAIREALTGLYNRRFLEETFSREITRARRESEPLSLIFVDLDHFKAVNDSYGHAAGDEVLQAISQFLVQSARASDMVCRYGGEELLVICPGMEIGRAHV